MPLAITDERPIGELTGSRGSATDRAMTKPYIAIVDDDAAFASYLQTFLSLRGYDARCYGRGDELLAAMKQSDVPDAVLLDVMMPGLDGMATLRALKSSRPEAQVIMLSGRNQPSVIVEAVQAGATDYVVKPDDPEGSRRDRARRRHQERHREDQAGLRVERAAPAAHRQRGSSGVG